MDFSFYGRERAMSAENVKAFFEKAEGDKALQAKLKALEAKAQGHKKDVAAELVRIAGEAGFKFGADDLANVRKADGGELSEKELRQVAGGEYHCTGTAAKWVCKNVTF